MVKKQAKKPNRPSELISGAQRLNRVLAAAGLGSRRDVEQLIVEGRVDVDGKTVTDLALKVDPKESVIQVDGVSLKKHRPVYFALNKPTGVLSTNADPSGRTRVVDLVPTNDRIFPVGRLDRSSEGLMLLTNDGELAQRLAHPRYGIQKTYFVVVQGIISHEELAKLRKGVYLADGVARIDGAKIRRQRKTCTEIEIILSEGKNREIRRILARVGHKVVVLRRLAIGPLRLAQLPVGQTRPLTHSEVEALYSATSDAAIASRRQAERAASGTKSTKGARPKPAKNGFAAAQSGTRPKGYSSGTKSVRTTPSRGAAPFASPAVRPASSENEFNLQGFGSGKSGSVLSYDEPVAKEPPIKPRTKRSERTPKLSNQSASSKSAEGAPATGRGKPMRAGGGTVNRGTTSRGAANQGPGRAGGPARGKSIRPSKAKPGGGRDRRGKKA